jgi:hypothetical protein
MLLRCPQSVEKGLRQLALASLFCLIVAGVPRRAFADVWTFDQRSDPQGIIATQSGTYMLGTTLQTVNAPLSSSGYGFACWTVNGQRVSGLIGQSLTRADFVLTTNTAAIAWYLVPSLDSDGDGVADYLELLHYGSLTNGPGTDSDSDGFIYADELVRGYSAIIRDEPEDGGVMMRVSASSTYRDASERKSYDIRSDPQGIVTTLGGYAVTGTVITTVSVPVGASSGYYFGYWEVNGVRQADPSGQALSRVTLTLTNDTMAVARFFSAGDSDADGLDDWREWYWFGSLAQNLTSDPDVDGFSVSNELARGYSVQVKDEPEDGGMMLRLSSVGKYRDEAERKRYDIRSAPQGIVTTLGGYAVTGSVVTTVSVPMGASSGYYFGYWEVNGIRQAAPSGLALSRVSLVMTNDMVAVARFFSSGDSDADGLDDWREWYWFGDLSQNMNADFDDDGFTVSNELMRGYAVQIKDEPDDGGIMLRLSAPGKYREEAERKRYDIRSDPQGIVSSINGYVVTGSVVTTVSVPMGASSGYYFGYWEVNGVRQAASSGLALSRVALVMTNDMVAIARFFSAGDSDADGLEDWREWYWFGNLSQNLNSDFDGDGYTISNELARGYAVQIKDEPEDGGIMMRVSQSMKIWLDYYPRSTGILIDGLQKSGFADSGGTPGALNVGGCAAPALGDWDGDGDLDLMVAGAGGVLRIWENAGSPMAPNLSERTGNFSALSWAWNGIATTAAALGDWSGDGRADLVVGGSTGQVVAVASTGNFLNPQISSITCRLDSAASGAIPALADLYKRGRCDLLLLLPDGTINVYTNTGIAQAPFSEATVRTNLLGTAVLAATGLAVVDTDDDGDLDVLVSDDTGRIWEFQQSAGTFTLKTTVYAGTYSGFARRLTITAGDFDGDGDSDVIGGFAEGGLIYLKNPSPKLLVTPSTATVFSGQQVSFKADKGVAGAINWSFLTRRSGGTLNATNGLYTAGATGSCVDVIQAAASGVRGRAYVNVISAEDVARSGKAVVIAGRASSNDPVWPTTRYLANNGYNALRYRGFGKDNICYLSPVPGVDVDGDGQTNDIAALSTRANVAATFTNWVGNADKLFVYLVDHGGVAEGQGFFRLSPAETISASELNLWLTALQNRWGTEVTLVIDCCNSGSFVPWLAYPGPAKRVVITACGADEPTIFVAGGLVSFSEAFFSGLMLGLSAGEAFLSAQSAMASYQAACLDDDGNGAYIQGVDGTYASGVRVGASFVAGKDVPQIRAILDNQQLSGGTVATLWADDVVSAYPVARVWCQVVSPGYLPDPANPVIDLPQLELTYNSGTRRYEAQYAGFSEEGTYKLIYYAKDIWGSVSLPRQSYVFQSGFLERAVIVAGGAVGDANWAAVDKMADFAYTVLSQRRLSTNAICYLSSRMKPGVDGTADRAGLMNAVTNWAKGSNKLSLYLVGTTGGAGGSFRLNGSETVSAAEADVLFDAFQATGAAVTAVLDFDGSGGWLPALPRANRVCVASASSGQKASFRNQGLLSFSCFFFDYVFNGLDVWTAYSNARDKIRNASGRKQDALLDSDGDGKYVAKIDQTLARQWYLGSAFMTGADAPTVEAVTPDTVLTNAFSLTLWASGVADIGGVSNVFCLVTPPDDSGSFDAPRVDLTWSLEAERYEAVCGGFTSMGAYAVTFFALDSEGQLSMPHQTLVEWSAVDSNTNGIPEVWEYAYGLANVSETSDADGDGFFDFSEYVAGTDPTNRFSLLRLTALEPSEATGSVLRWTGVSGKRYRVSWTTNLAVWPSDQFMSVGGTNAWSDASEPRPAIRFYRVGVELPQ